MHLKKLLGIALASAFVASAVQARDFRSADVHPLDYPTVMTVKKIGEIADFSDAILQKRPPALALDESLRNMRVLETLLKQSRS